MSSYLKILASSVKRMMSVNDFACLKLILLTPFLYALGFHGMINTGRGRMRSQNRQELRAIMYGTFKTHFCYLRNLAGISNRNAFFSIVVDVGANVGDFTIGISNKSERIIAIEPGRANFDRLQSNILDNHLKNVSAEKCAAHHSNEQVFLEGTNSDLRITSGIGETADGVRLDALLNKPEIDEVDLIKIDVQGHEEHVISGLTNFLESGRVKLAIIELHPKRGVSLVAVVNRMRMHGYRLALEDDYLFGQTQLYFVRSSQVSSEQGNRDAIPIDGSILPDSTSEVPLRLPVS